MGTTVVNWKSKVNWAKAPRSLCVSLSLLPEQRSAMADIEIRCSTNPQYFRHQNDLTWQRNLHPVDWSIPQNLAAPVPSVVTPLLNAPVMGLKHLRAMALCVSAVKAKAGAAKL